MPEPITAVAAAVSTFAASSATTAFLVKVGASLAFSAVSRALSKPSGASRPAELIRELTVPDSRPPYRYVYGRYRIYGSPAPWRVKGRMLYGCLILNSRPSVGGDIKVFVDKREVVEPTGDLFDFSGDGLRFQLPAPAVGFTENGRPRMWLGLGEQTTPPDAILAAVPEFFQALDGWRGRTVLWLEFDAGDTGYRGDRWPRVPPEIEVEMDWSRVWNPQDPTQLPDDETTWQFSNNHALVLLDALRTNPIRQYDTRNLLLDTFIDSAHVSDEIVSLKTGGTEPRYTANGMIIWDGREIEEQVQPIIDSGGGTTVRTGGRLGYLAGAYRAPIYTATDILADGGVEFKRLLPGRDLPRSVLASYINPQRDWKEADLPPRSVPDSQPTLGDDGAVNLKLPFCTSPTQAMRIQKIAALKAGKQKRLSCVLPPDAFDVLAGATISMALPAFERLNGLWELTSVNPGVSLASPGEGVALRVPVELIETDAAVYAWSIEDEIDLASEAFVPTRQAISPPSDLLAFSGVDESIGGLPTIRFSFAPSPSGSVVNYEWQWRESGGDYEQGGYIEAGVADAQGRVFGRLATVESGKTYDIRVRASALFRTSSYIEVLGALATGKLQGAKTSLTQDLVMLAAPGVDAQTTQANFAWRQPTPVVVGSPTYTANGLTSSENDYVDFAIEPTGSRTMAFVVYVPDVEEAVAFSATNPALDLGESLRLTSTTLQFETVHVLSTGYPALGRVGGRFDLIAVVVENNTALRMYRPRDAALDEKPHAGVNFDLVGRSYRTSQQGETVPSKAPLFAYWERALTNAELNIFYNEMRGYLFTRGLDIG